MSTLARVELSRSSRPFVCSSFAGSFSKYSGLSQRVDFDRHVMEPFERALDGSPPTILALAASPDDFVGWSLIVGDALVYLYVKQAFRGRGVGRLLLADGLERAVYQTPAGIRLQQHRYGRALRLAPFLLMAASVKQREAA